MKYIYIYISLFSCSARLVYFACESLSFSVSKSFFVTCDCNQLHFLGCLYCSDILKEQFRLNNFNLKLEKENFLLEKPSKK